MARERILPDGLNAYSGGVVGPSLADVREFGSHSHRGRVAPVELNPGIEIFIRNSMSPYPQEPAVTEITEPRLKAPKIKRWPKKYAATAAVILNTLIAACSTAPQSGTDTTGGQTESPATPNAIQTTEPEASPSKTPDSQVLGAETYKPNINIPMPIASNVDVFYTGGPHNYNAPRNKPTNLIRGAFDIAPKDIDCVNGIVPFPVVSSIDGEVTLVNERTGFVNVKVAGQKDLVIEYEHLAGINGDNLSDGKVKVGESIADGVGCSNDQRHLHFQLQNSKGEQLPIAGSTIGGWTIYEYEGNYDGYAVKSGQKKIADEYHILGKNDLVTADKSVGNVYGPGTTEYPFASPFIQNPEYLAGVEFYQYSSHSTFDRSPVPYTIDAPSGWGLSYGSNLDHFELSYHERVGVQWDETQQSPQEWIDENILNTVNAQKYPIDVHDRGTSVDENGREYSWILYKEYESGGPFLEKGALLFRDGSYVWIFSYRAFPDNNDMMSTYFARMLSSFRFEK